MQSFITRGELATCPMDRTIIEASGWITRLSVHGRPDRRRAVYHRSGIEMVGNARSVPGGAIEVYYYADFRLRVSSMRNGRVYWRYHINWVWEAQANKLIYIKWPALEALYEAPRTSWQSVDSLILTTEMLDNPVADMHYVTRECLRILSTQNVPAHNWLRSRLRHNPRLTWRLRLYLGDRSRRIIPEDFLCIVPTVPVPNGEGIPVACLMVTSSSPST